MVAAGMITLRMTDQERARLEARYTDLNVLIAQALSSQLPKAVHDLEEERAAIERILRNEKPKAAKASEE